jgi:nicotinamidase/pyrazinamidase
MENNILLIIDMQNDFCDERGTLYVPGAQEDVSRLAKFIRLNNVGIKQIILTQDVHKVNDIAHPSFWKNENGEIPKPFTQIKYDDVQENIWIPQFYETEVKEYLKQLEHQGEYLHTIWPEHCIENSWGAALCDEIMIEINNRIHNGLLYEIVQKGLNPLTEHFGAFRANIPIATDENTQFNVQLKNKLREAGNIYIAGEAKSHCVANTIKQMFEFPDLIKKLIIIENCMSNVPNCENLADNIYNTAYEMGATLIKI